MSLHKIINNYFKTNKITGIFEPNPHPYSKVSSNLLKIIFLHKNKLENSIIINDNLIFLINADSTNKNYKEFNNKNKYLLTIINISSNARIAPKIDYLLLDNNLLPTTCLLKEKNNLEISSHRLGGIKKEKYNVKISLVCNRIFKLPLNAIDLVNIKLLKEIILKINYDQSFMPSVFLDIKANIENSFLNQSISNISEKKSQVRLKI